MLTPEEHTQLLRSFEVDRLLKLVTLEAKRLHDGHFTIFAFTTEFKVAFGTPQLYPFHDATASYQLNKMPSYPTLKEALIAALVAGKDFFDYFDGDGEARFAAELAQMQHQPGIATPTGPPPPTFGEHPAWTATLMVHELVLATTLAPCGACGGHLWWQTEGQLICDMCGLATALRPYTVVGDAKAWGYYSAAKAAAEERCS